MNEETQVVGDEITHTKQTSDAEAVQALTGMTAEAILQQALPESELYINLRRSAQNLVDLDALHFTFEGINDQQQVLWTSPNSYPKTYCPKKQRFDDYVLEFTQWAVVMKLAVALAQHVIAESSGAEPEPDIVAKARRVLRLEKVGDEQEAPRL